ncbi:hypothetical protein ACIBU0_33315 [Streptomyces sp. NPDC049627]
MSTFLPADHAVRAEGLLVSLCPRVDYVIVFYGMAGRRLFGLART